MLTHAARRRLDQALTRAKSRLVEQNTTTPETVVEPEPIVIKDRSHIYVIPVRDLDYVEAQGDYVALHAKGRRYLKLQPISHLETLLDGSRFVRVHRSKIVNLERIARIAPYYADASVTLADGTRLSVSRSGYARLLEVMGTASERAEAAAIAS
jgi:two-component system LytT family response regulator